jgi:hypothetical protein
MPYDANSLDRFVQKQGGSLANLGASPTYTGAPAQRGTPPQTPYMQANPNAAFQQPPQGSLQRLGVPQRPQMPMRPGTPGQQMPIQQGGRFQMNPQQQQKLAMIQQRMQMRSRMPQLGAPQQRGY